MPSHMFALNTHEKMGSDNTFEKANEYATPVHAGQNNYQLCLLLGLVLMIMLAWQRLILLLSKLALR